MSEFIIHNGELYHHGVKGMKWGVRRYRNPDGSLTPAGKKRYGSEDVANKHEALRTAQRAYNKSFNKAYDRAGAALSPFKKHRKANEKRWEDAGEKARELQKAKSDYKTAKTKQATSAVKKYEKQRDKAREAQKVADQKWSEVEERRKAMGKTAVQRFFASFDSKNAATKAYNKAWDAYDKADGKAAAEALKMRETYINTGRNRVERALNNARYGR
jgi:hypothetical protein